MKLDLQTVEWQFTDSITGKPDWERIAAALESAPSSSSLADKQWVKNMLAGQRLSVIEECAEAADQFNDPEWVSTIVAAIRELKGSASPSAKPINDVAPQEPGSAIEASSSNPAAAAASPPASTRQQFWCDHVGGLGPPFPHCKICEDKSAPIAPTTAIPDGYAVVMDDKAAPSGYWFVACYGDPALAMGVAGKQKARMVPIFFASSAIACKELPRLADDHPPHGVYLGWIACDRSSAGGWWEVVCFGHWDFYDEEDNWKDLSNEDGYVNGHGWYAERENASEDTQIAPLYPPFSKTERLTHWMPLPTRPVDIRKVSE